MQWNTFYVQILNFLKKMLFLPNFLVKFDIFGQNLLILDPVDKIQIVQPPTSSLVTFVE